MNRNIIMALLSTLLFAGCNGTNAEKNDTTSTQPSEPQITATPISQLLQSDTLNLNHEVVTSGLVTHVCSHSGKRCFIEDSLGLSIKVEAKGSINGFNKELTGMRIRVKGILRANYIDEEQMEGIEAKLEEKEEHDHCSTERNNIKRMREWMQTNNSSSYPIFYIDAEEYEIEEP